MKILNTLLGIAIFAGIVYLLYYFAYTHGWQAAMKCQQQGGGQQPGTSPLPSAPANLPTGMVSSGNSIVTNSGGDNGTVVTWLFPSGFPSFSNTQTA